MKDDQARYIIDEISKEHFIAEHYFFYVSQGLVTLYDGKEYMELTSGECCITRKNRLGRYYKRKVNGELAKTIIALDEAFLKRFEEKHPSHITAFTSPETCVRIKQNDLLSEYIQSLQPYYHHGTIQEAFADVKREELLIILLRAQPELAGLLFDYGSPHKVNIEEFMNRNYTFNVSVEQFAYLTGRSLSAFKRDFKKIFKETPNRWLIQKRLNEAHFLIEKKNKKPSEIYINLDFETLPHFSFAFKKKFGLTPSQFIAQRIK